MLSSENVEINSVQPTKFGLKLPDDGLKAFTSFGVCFCGSSGSCGGIWAVLEMFR